jgi:hypothetical protein
MVARLGSWRRSRWNANGIRPHEAVVFDARCASLTQGARTVRLAAGDFAIYDTSRPYSLSVAEGTRQLVLKMPRKSVDRRLGMVSKYLATAVRRADPLGGFASGFLQLIPKRAAALEDLPPSQLPIWRNRSWNLSRSPFATPPAATSRPRRPRAPWRWPGSSLRSTTICRTQDCGPPQLRPPLESACATPTCCWPPRALR